MRERERTPPRWTALWQPKRHQSRASVADLLDHTGCSSRIRPVTYSAETPPTAPQGSRRVHPRIPSRVHSPDRNQMLNGHCSWTYVHTDRKSSLCTIFRTSSSLYQISDGVRLALAIFQRWERCSSLQPTLSRLVLASSPAFLSVGTTNERKNEDSLCHCVLASQRAKRRVDAGVSLAMDYAMAMGRLCTSSCINFTFIRVRLTPTKSGRGGKRERRTVGEKE